MATREIKKKAWEKTKAEMSVFGEIEELESESEKLSIEPTSEADSNRIVKALNSCSFDSGRSAVIDTIRASGKSVTATQVGRWLNLFSHDSGRCELLNKIGHLVVDPHNLALYGNTMSHDSGRDCLHKWCSRSTPVGVELSETKRAVQGFPTFLVFPILSFLLGAALGVAFL